MSDLRSDMSDLRLDMSDLGQICLASGPDMSDH
jgi:hypothetical protein